MLDILQSMLMTGLYMPYHALALNFRDDLYRQIESCDAEPVIPFRFDHLYDISTAWILPEEKMVTNFEERNGERFRLFRIAVGFFTIFITGSASDDR